MPIDKINISKSYINFLIHRAFGPIRCTPPPIDSFLYESVCSIPSYKLDKEFLP